MTNYSEIIKALADIGVTNTSVGEDNNGQIIIYTNLREIGDEWLVDMDNNN